MIRYFIGIDPPAVLRERIAAVMRSLGDPTPVPHITVKDPRGLTEDLSWLPRVRAEIARLSPLTVTLGPLAHFDHRVLFLSVQCPGLDVVHERIAAHIPLPREDLPGVNAVAPFTPHLTLWVQRGGRSLPSTHELASALGDLGSFRARELTLFRRARADAPYHPWRQLPFDE